MGVWESLLAIACVLGGWLFYEALRSRESAVRATRDACKRQGLQLLDDTVHGTRLRLARDANGIVRVRRTFEFDFSEDGFNRRSGRVVMLGETIEALELEPYAFER
ncbi:MAG: DUF3301 domain-containing protein [Betaproteobacteria bacterium]